MNITQDLAARVLQIVDQGLCRGVGEPTPGSMCVEAAVCYALGEPHGDNPSCVDAVLRTLNTRLNDALWSSNGARAKGMRRLAVAQLGTRGDFDQKVFVTSLVRVTISKVLPKVLRIAAALQQEPHKTSLLEVAQRCETEGSYEAAWAAAEAAAWAAAEAAARTTAGAAVAAAEAATARAANEAAWEVFEAAKAVAADPAQAADAVARAADRTAEGAIGAAANKAWWAANMAARAAAADRLLADFAEEVVQILVAMKTPGSQFLSLTEKGMRR